MNKAYQRIVWENYPSDNTPINESNLNRMDASIDIIDDRVVGFDTTKANQSDLLQSLRSIAYNDQTGVFTFTFWNGTTYTADLNIEKIPVTFSMSAQGILTMTTADGTEFTADIASLIKLYTFNASTDISFNTVTDASGNKTITAFIVNGSVTEEKLQPNFLADCRAEVSVAETEAQNAEAWARGTKDGTDVTSTDPQYHNNAKYYSEQSRNSATNAGNSELSAANNAQLAQMAATNAGNAQTAAETAQSAAENAQDAAESAEANASNSELSAESSAEDSEAYAVGKRDGIDVTSGDVAYQNNSKYYAQQASASASSASSSASSASANATAASNYADQSKSYAVGTNGVVRVGDATDNAKYYYEQARDISQTLAGTLRPKGTVTFSNLPSLSSADEGDMYNVSDAFITTADFKEGAGVSVAAGSNVYKTADNFWDILAGSPVTGVKGDAESNYRQGNVNITPANLGIDLAEYLRLDGENSLPEVNDVDTFKNGIGIVTGNTSHNPHPQGLSGILISFADPLNANSMQLFTDTNTVLKRVTVFVSGSGYVWTGWGSSFGTYLKPNFTEASTRSNIASGETISTLFGKIKKWFSDLKTVAFSGSYNDLNDKLTTADEEDAGLVPHINTEPSIQLRQFLRGDNTWQELSGSVKDLARQATVNNPDDFHPNYLEYAICDSEYSPCNDDGVILWIPYDSTYGQQIMLNDDGVQVYHRWMDDGKWGEWLRFYDDAYHPLSGTRPSSVTPKNSGKSTLLQYILEVVYPKNCSTYSFPASGFSDLPTNDWGYNVIVNTDGGAMNVVAYKQLSSSEYYVRAISSSGQWLKQSWDSLALNSNLNANYMIQSGLAIFDYNSTSNMYRAPSDGYVFANSWGSQTCSVNLCDSSGVIYITKSMNTAPFVDALFVKKGTYIYVTYTSTNSLQIFFRPVVPE